MTGLKSGSGDDLWGDDDEPEDEQPGAEAEDEADAESTEDTAPDSETESASSESQSPTTGSRSDSSRNAGVQEQDSTQQPYIVRRAIQDKSVQFERDERLTFFVHDDVVDGERELLQEVESALGRDVPKFDVREAVYRAALRNREDVLAELIEMGYSASE